MPMTPPADVLKDLHVKSDTVTISKYVEGGPDHKAPEVEIIRNLYI